MGSVDIPTVAGFSGIGSSLDDDPMLRNLGSIFEWLERPADSEFLQRWRVVTYLSR
jgi:hypothetical protein